MEFKHIPAQGKGSEEIHGNTRQPTATSAESFLLLLSTSHTQKSECMH